MRKEGRAKVTGQALYVDDVTPAGMLHGVTVRSPVARGRISGITFDPGDRLGRVRRRHRRRHPGQESSSS